MTHSTIDGSEYNAVTADGDDIKEITVDGTVVWQAVQIVDDFEDGDDSGWDVPSSTGSDAVVTPGLDNTDYKWEITGFREPHLSGNSTVDRGPQPGDLWEFWFQITNTTSGGVINRFEFATYGQDDGHFYRIEWERETGDNELSIEKYSGGSQELVDTDPNFSPSMDFPYRCRIGWNHGDNQIAVDMITPGGDIVGSVSITDDSSASASFQDQGIRIENSGNNTCEYDEIKITDTI